MGLRENAKSDSARPSWRRYKAINEQVIKFKDSRQNVSLISGRRGSVARWVRESLRNYLRLKNQIGQFEPLDPLINKLKKISRELIGFHNQPGLHKES